MQRANVAGIIAGVTVGVLTLLLFVVPVPYAVLSPGPVCNTVGGPTPSCRAVGNATQLISVPAGYDHPSRSRLGFTTVSEMTNEPSAAGALFAWLSSSDAVVPQEVLHPPGQSAQAVQSQDTNDMIQAQDNAVTVAEEALHLIDLQVLGVSTGPARGVLQPGDVLLDVDGQPVTTASQFLARTSSPDPATVYAVTLRRAGATMTVVLHKSRSTVSGEAGKLLFGITIGPGPRVPVQITLDPQVIGGPSAGLMFALGVYDLLTTGDLAGSTVVAGTGTIDDSGNVGPIGGIQQKMYAARHSFHATVFLAPAANCSDVRGSVPHGLRVVPVDSFAAALAVLADVRSGALAGLPHC